MLGRSKLLGPYDLNTNSDGAESAVFPIDGAAQISVQGVGLTGTYATCEVHIFVSNDGTNFKDTNSAIVPNGDIIGYPNGTDTVPPMCAFGKLVVDTPEGGVSTARFWVYLS